MKSARSKTSCWTAIQGAWLTLSFPLLAEAAAVRRSVEAAKWLLSRGLSIRRQADPNVLTVTVERDRIYNAPVFDYARVEEYSRPDYINECLQLLRRERGSGSWSWCFWRYFNDHNRRNHDNGGELQRPARQQVRIQRQARQQARRQVSRWQGSPAPNATEGRRAHPGAAAAAGAAAVRARETATPSLSERAGERTPSAKQKQGKPTPPSSRSETGTRSESAKAPSEQTTTGEKATGSQRREKGKRETKPSEKPPGD